MVAGRTAYGQHFIISDSASVGFLNVVPSGGDTRMQLQRKGRRTHTVPTFIGLLRSP